MSQTLVPCACGRGTRDARAARCRLCWAETSAAAATARLCSKCGGRRDVTTDAGGKVRYRCRPCEARAQRERHVPQPRRGRAPVTSCKADEGCARPAEYPATGLCRKHYERFRRLGHTGPLPPRSADPVKAAEAQLRASARALGLDPVQIVAHCRAHNGRCDACGGPPSKKRLDIDHCHTTGRFRGLLCGNCNRAAGLVADDPARLRALADYLDRAP